MTDPLRFLWPAVEAVQPVVAREGIVRWPGGVHAQLVAAGLLRPAADAVRIRCPACGRTHAGPPIARRQPDGSVRYFIKCPEHLRAEVKQRDREQWEVDVEALAKAIAASLSLHGKCTAIGGDRVWRCGRTNLQGEPREVLFARGLARKDFAQHRRDITGAHRPIVFVGTELPESEFWNGKVPTLVRLAEVASIVDGKLEIDIVETFGIVQALDSTSDGGWLESMTPEQFKLAVRRQMKAESQSALTDEWLIRAYRQYGSYRAAAEALSEAVDHKIGKDQVSRAVQRAGGIDVVMRIDDSESVVRNRSSRRRDTAMERRDSSK